MSKVGSRGLLRVVAALVVDDLACPERLLVARRTRPERLRGLWELPGGKVEPGESEVEALHRELHEELGVAVTVAGVVPGPHEDGWWGDDPAVRIRLFLVGLLEGCPRPLDGHDQVRWLPRPGWANGCEWMRGNAVMAAAGESLVDEGARIGQRLP